MKCAKLTAGRWLVLTATAGIAVIFAAGTALQAPLVLIPVSPSLPSKPYLRTFEEASTGKIVTVALPAVAQLYYRQTDMEAPRTFMKPVVAVAGDTVCNSVGGGLTVNGHRLAGTMAEDTEGRPLPLWQQCRPLATGEMFLFSSHAPNSFDSRYYGPIKETDVIGVYRPMY